MEMYAERRLEPKRIDMEKRVELFGTDGIVLGVGCTDNMSDAGIGARFDKLSELGSEVNIKLHWHPDEAPIEQLANVVWQSTDKDNGVSVGFRLQEEPSSETRTPQRRRVNVKACRNAELKTPAESASSTQVSLPLLTEGAEVWVEKEGVAIRAEVAGIGDILEENHVDVVLRVTDPAFQNSLSAAQDDPLSPELQDFSPHPFRNAWKAVVPYVRPVLALLARGAAGVKSLTLRGIETVVDYLRNRRASTSK